MGTQILRDGVLYETVENLKAAQRYVRAKRIEQPEFTWSIRP